MRVEVLGQIPVSGTVIERQFRTSAGENLWVRFELDDGSEWVGVFGGLGMASYHAAVLFPDDPPTALVVAGGQGYVVDPRTGELLRETPWNYSYSAVPVPGRDFVLVADNTAIWATFRDRDAAVLSDHAWYDDDPTRLAADGIVLASPGTVGIDGYVWELHGWYGFTLWYDRLRFERGSSVTSDFEAIRGSVERGGYPPRPSAAGAPRTFGP